MSTVFQFKNNYVAVKDLHQTHVTTKKMSYVDFYKMLRDMEENPQEALSNSTVSADIMEMKQELRERYQTLFNYTGRATVPNNLRQFKLIDSERVILVLEMGSKSSYFIDRKHHDELDFVNFECDFGSEYLVELEIGYNNPTRTEPKPNSVDFRHVYRRVFKTVDGKPSVELEEVPYLLEKMNDFNNTHIVPLRSKITTVRNMLYGNYDVTIENVLRKLSHKDLENETLMERVAESIENETKINWEGVEY